MNELTVSRQEQAALIHNRILANGQIAAQALVAMCQDLKKMRDDKLFEELNYSSFEDYAEQACGIKQRQAYSYIAALERLGADYIEQNAQLGITKLELISQVSSFEREEFLETVDVEDVSTRELKEELQNWKNQVEQLSLKLETAQNDYNELSSELEKADDEREHLEAELDEIKSRPTPVAIAETDEETIKKAVEQAKEENAELIKKLKQQVKDEKAKVKTVKEQTLKEANEKIDKLIAEGKEKDVKLQAAVKAAKVAGADEDVIAVRILFNDLQSTANNLKEYIGKINAKDEEKAKKLSEVMKKTINSIAESL